MRSIATVAVLSSSGLDVPADSATLSYIDNIVLRTFSADSPGTGQSSFSIEMQEMRQGAVLLLFFVDDESFLILTALLFCTFLSIWE